jgi:hypothetical protein
MLEQYAQNSAPIGIASMGKTDFISSLFMITDEQAMWRVQMHDDHCAFTRLIQRWETPILRLCSRMTGDVHRGEDLKQETFARVFAKRKDFRPEARSRPGYGESP